jgi:hypothetical protein
MASRQPRFRSWPSVSRAASVTCLVLIRRSSLGVLFIILDTDRILISQANEHVDEVINDKFRIGSHPMRFPPQCVLNSSALRKESIKEPTLELRRLSSVEFSL